VAVLSVPAFSQFGVGDGVHPRGDGKSAQALGCKGDNGAPLRKRVRKRMKILGLYVRDKKEGS
jgi:hypothetical protein